MDEQQGKVIDGTARARQWRRSRSKAAAPLDGAEVRSEAPRGIASSLMIPGAITPDAPALTSGTAEHTGHQNPFLLPDAEAVGVRPATRSKRRGSITTLIAQLAATGSAGRRAVQRVGATITLRPRLWVGRTALAAGLSASAIAAVLLAQSPGSSAPHRSRSSAAQGAIALERLRPRVSRTAAQLPAAAHPSRPAASEQARRARTHRAAIRHHRTHPANTASTQPVHYSQPPPSSSPSPAPQTSTYANSGSSSSATASDQPAAHSSSAGSTATSKVQAFGPAGALGPGSSPSG